MAGGAAGDGAPEVPAGPPRVRFAPSPTGYFHVGSARTALFNWLFARGRQGTFILRIEDTDTERNREEWVDGIVDALDWLGMTPDEGPVRQSARADRYQEVVDRLWSAGHLYACDCTRQDVDDRRPPGAPPGYDGHCRDLGLERGPGRALRFRTPRQGATTVADLVRGDVAFPHAAMDDFVCVKSDGGPLFALANMVDDRDMAISHVIRGEELLPTAPKQILLWQALDGTDPGAAVALPRYAHLPILVNEAGKKLSKRRDPVSVESYRDQGYLPEAFRTYLALLGWSPPGDEERVPVEVLVSSFALEDVHSAPAFFDVAKLRHFNGEHIRDLPVAEFTARARPWLDPEPGRWRPPADPPWPAGRFDAAAFDALAPLVQERVATLDEVPAMVDFVFLADPPIDPADWERAVAGDDGAGAILRAARSAFETCDWAPDVLHAETLAVAESVGRKLGKAQAPLRVAVTGRRVGPPLFESLAVLGRDEVLRRLDAALARLDAG